jgi:hypothetical protein
MEVRGHAFMNGSSSVKPAGAPDLSAALYEAHANARRGKLYRLEP